MMRIAPVSNEVLFIYSNNVSRSFFRLFADHTEFRALNLRGTKSQIVTKKKFKKPDVLPPRSQQMALDHDWGSVWPGPRTFHPATVPLPIRQGYVKKGAPPSKYGNAELMKIPNFLHLTPPVIKRQCEALKQFCTPWPEGLQNDAQCEEHFPLEISSSTYCYSSPSIREPMARIVTVKTKLSQLPLDEHARDKFLRLVSNRYDEETDTLTIVADRCPRQCQNYDYAMYLLTAVYHESWRTETWEKTKSEADMERYDWNVSISKQNIEIIFGKVYIKVKYFDTYSKAVDALMNEGENEYGIGKYSEAVRKMFKLPLSYQEQEHK